MDRPEQSREFDIIVNRAKRAGLLKAHYADERLAVIELPPAPPASEAAPLALESPPPASGKAES